MNGVKDAKRLATLLIQTRATGGRSQEDMALELGVSRNTISNWEKGTSRPDMLQFKNWFEILGMNPIPYVLQFFYPDKYEGAKHKAPDDLIEEAVDGLLKSLSIDAQRDILYLLYGIKGDPFAMLQLFVTHSHLPMHYRYSIANHILATYQLCSENNTLVDLDKIMPDIDHLEKAIEAGKRAAIKGNDSYNIKKE